MCLCVPEDVDLLTHCDKITKTIDDDDDDDKGDGGDDDGDDDGDDGRFKLNAPRSGPSNQTLDLLSVCEMS